MAFGSGGPICFVGEREERRRKGSEFVTAIGNREFHWSHEPHTVVLTFAAGQGTRGGSAGRGQVHCSQGTCRTGAWEPGVPHGRWAKSPPEATKSEDFRCHEDGRARVSPFSSDKCRIS